MSFSRDWFLPARADADDSAASRGDARAAIVNRTHRVVRERAEAMRARRSRSRQLLLPLLICSALLLLVCYAAWATAAQNSTQTTAPGAAQSPAAATAALEDAGEQVEETAGHLLTGQVPDGSLPVYALVWFLPVTALTLTALLVRRARRHDREVTR